MFKLFEAGIALDDDILQVFLVFQEECFVLL